MLHCEKYLDSPQIIQGQFTARQLTACQFTAEQFSLDNTAKIEKVG
jgi:hypothetical protein